uniref:Ig-like domain-containing protein n=1 Tax=Seriola lalandi dorsalis TaxID=1841481 RepID=A0A3B4WQD4_SERLL
YQKLLLFSLPLVFVLCTDSIHHCADGESCNRVTYTNRSICAPERSSVDISCTYNSYRDNVGSKFWFRSELSRLPVDLSEDSQYSGRVQVLEAERGRSTLRITDLTKRDSADYRFKFKKQGFEWGNSLPGTTLTVTAVQLQVTRVITVHPSHTVAELNCHTSCRPIGRFIFVWFQNGEKIQEETSSYMHDFYPGDNITCALKGYEDYHSPSVYAPRAALLSVSPSGEIMKGSWVTLTCSSDANPAANYTWHKENQQLTGKEPQLVFNTIKVSDSGEYYCKAENGLGWRSSNYISINVKYGPQTSTLSVSPSGEIVEGSSVTLTCSSDANPAANYTWYKENLKLLQGPEGVYHFSSIRHERCPRLNPVKLDRDRTTTHR